MFIRMMRSFFVSLCWCWGIASVMAASVTGDSTPLATVGTASETKTAPHAAVARVTRPVREIAVIGNSITRHGPSPAIGWKGNWGMAATAEEKDYVHILHRRLTAWLAERGLPAPAISIRNGDVVEKDLSSWKTAPASKADILIIELGDNFRRCENFDPEKHFISLYARMLADFNRANPDQLIFCVSSWGDSSISLWIDMACDRANAKFVDLGLVSNNPASRAKSEGHFTNGGVNWHPGDKGMAGIADILFNHITTALEATDRR